jgi:hypothetical protein
MFNILWERLSGKGEKKIPCCEKTEKGNFEKVYFVGFVKC